MVNDDLPNRILSGTVSVKPNIQEFRGSSVVFEDGTVEDDIDLVVFATGYTFSFPFLSSHVIPVSKNKVSLYKYIYPPGLERPTLAMIGLIQPLGAIMPISEMQARWATRVFKGIKHDADRLHRKIQGVPNVYFHQNVVIQFFVRILHPVELNKEFLTNIYIYFFIIISLDRF